MFLLKNRDNCKGFESCGGKGVFDGRWAIINVMGTMRKDWQYCDWKQVLRTIYSPPIGSIWTAPNAIWTNSFAHNKAGNDTHPSVVGRVFEKDRLCWVIPGTTKTYNKGSNVFRTKINPDNPDCPDTHFLIALRMTCTIEELLELKRGWNGIDDLRDSQVEELKLQIRFSLGINV